MSSFGFIPASRPRLARLFVWLVPALLLLGGAPPARAGATATLEFASLDPAQDKPARGFLYLPEHPAGPCPAVVIVHGTSGTDARGSFHRKALLEAGIATFEVDFKSGIFTSPADRPPQDFFIPYAFSALKELRQRKEVDPARIGIMGFSLGGGVTLNTAIDKYRARWIGQDQGFTAHAAIYPGCKGFMKRLEKGGGTLTGAPMIVFYGTKDAYGDGEGAPALKQFLLDKFQFDLKTVEYPGLPHGFDLDEKPKHYKDPAAIDGLAYMAYDAAAAKDARTQVVAFMKEHLAAR